MSAPSPTPAFKRPALKKKPPPAADPAVPAAPAQGGGAAGGLLSSILEGVRKLDEACTRAGVVGDVSIKPAEERAAEARKQFEREAEALMRLHVQDSPDELASFDFVPTEKPWRDVLHEIAAGMGLYSETVEAADGDRYVVVSKKPLPGSRHEIEQLKMQSRMVPTKVARKVDALPPPEIKNGVVALNVNKRDLRTIEQVQHEMASRKQPRTETGARPQTNTGDGAT